MLSIYNYLRLYVSILLVLIIFALLNQKISLMTYTQTEQYMWADRIMQAVCTVGGITFMQLVSEARTTKTNELRGLYCLITRDYNIHPERAARLISRTRQNVINQTRRYWQYLQAKDKTITALYNKIKDFLKRYDNEKRL